MPSHAQMKTMRQLLARVSARRLSLAALVCVSLWLSACASPGGRLVLWHSLDGLRARALEQLVDRWNAQAWQRGAATIVIERRSPAQQHGRLSDLPDPALLPDLALVSPSQAALYHERGLLSDLRPLADSADPNIGWSLDERRDLFPFVLSAGRDQRGALIGVPQGGKLRLALANLNVLLQADSIGPFTLALDRLCDEAIQRGAQACFSTVLDGVVVEEWLRTRGVSSFDPSTGLLRLDDPEVLTRLDLMAQDVASARLASALSLEAQIDNFISGRYAVMLLWSDELDLVLAASRQREDVRLDVISLQTPARQAVLYRAPLWVVPRTPRAQEREAWQFIRWTTEADQARFWYEQTGELPARSIEIPSSDGAASALRTKVITQIAPLAQPEPLHPNWLCAQNVLAALVQRLLDRQPLDVSLRVVRAQAAQQGFGACVSP